MHRADRLDDFAFVSAGPPEGPPVVLLHGMLGEADNWTDTLPALEQAGYRAIALTLPVYTSPLDCTSVAGLTEYVLAFLNYLGGPPPVLVGNSLGGHVALCVASEKPRVVRALVLSGASGLYEVNIGATTPRRFDRAFVQDRTAFTFFDPVHATEALVDRMMSVLADRNRLLRLVRMARSTHQTGVAPFLPRLRLPTLLVWGLQDRITPPDVARRFESLLPESTLVLLEACGHAPMIEQPDAFNRHLMAFLHRVVPVSGRPHAVSAGEHILSAR